MLVLTCRLLRWAFAAPWATGLLAVLRANIGAFSSS
jgi:hypothetical protein